MTTLDPSESPRGGQASATGEDQLRHLFEYAPVSLWREDFSQVKVLIDGLLAQGVSDLAAYFREHPEFVQACAEKAIVLDVNQETLALHEAETKQELLESLPRIFTKRSLEVFGAQLANLASGKSVFEAEAEVQTLSGGLRTVLLKILCDARWEDWSLVYVAQVDVTAVREAEAAQQELERRMTATRKLESLAVLAGGVAHDFSNLLMIIQGNVHVALAEAEPGGTLEESLLEIQDATSRASVLSKQMLAYAGRSRLTKKVCSLGEIAAALPRQLAAEKGVVSKLDLEPDPDEASYEVVCDAAQICQVLQAMVMNASDAIGEGPGRIRVRTGSLIFEPDKAPGRDEAEQMTEALPHAPEPGRRYVYVDVEDEGSGMDATVKARMFDPFFSTKAPGRGLGMAAVLGIVRAHKGALHVTSAPGEGTTVRMLLPADSSKTNP